MRRTLPLLFLVIACSKKSPVQPVAPDAAPADDTKTFATPEDAFKEILALHPAILAVGEAHAPKGSEGIPSSTKRFTETLLPLVTASDIVVELWAPDPSCQKEVKAVASAQKVVVEHQAATNQNEYVTLGTRAKALGVTPWLLRPTCDDFAMLADAGDDAVGDMLGLVKRLTQTKLEKLYAARDANGGKTLLAYGGAMHNDIVPAPDMKEYSFGVPLSEQLHDAYVELDLIVPEYIKDTPSWTSMPWYATWASRRGKDDPSKTTLFRTGKRSFVIVFPASR